MDLHILASGSSGNCTCVEHNDKYIFIDVGAPVSRIKKSLGAAALADKDISVFITHEHFDHISGLLPFIRAFPAKVYTSEKTSEILSSLGVADSNLFVLDAGSCYDFDDFSVTPFDLTHDAVEPFGYRFDIGGKIFSIATDFGAVSEYIMKSLAGTEILVLESNYEDEILKKCGYPAVLKSRISSIRGHLSNKDAFRMVGELSASGLKRCFFAHVSENSNDYELLDRYAKNCKDCYTVETVALRQGSYVRMGI